MRISDLSSDVCSSDLQKAEQFSWHSCAKGQNAASSHDNPFIVRAVMADQPVGSRHSVAYSTEQLDFLAAHHIGAIIGPIAYAGNDDCVVQPDGLINEVSQSSGAGHIRRFDPSTAGTDQIGRASCRERGCQYV